jgi:hypothetical protein
MRGLARQEKSPTCVLGCGPSEVTFMSMSQRSGSSSSSVPSCLASLSSLPSRFSRRQRWLLLFALSAGLGTAAAYLPVGSARAQKPAAAPAPAAAGGKPAAEAPKCKAWGTKPMCCDPAIAAHLTKEAVFSACGESEATFLGEQGSKETCKYVFKVEGQKEEETFVQVYVPVQKEVPSEPNDPFFQWKKIGKVFVTEKAKSPKAAPMMVNSTGLWLPGKGYTVSVNASTKVCDKGQAKKLASSMK